MHISKSLVYNSAAYQVAIQPCSRDQHFHILFRTGKAYFDHKNSFDTL